jgi:hypothetical protein
MGLHSAPSPPAPASPKATPAEPDPAAPAELDPAAPAELDPAAPAEPDPDEPAEVDPIDGISEFAALLSLQAATDSAASITPMGESRLASVIVEHCAMSR